MDIYSDSIRDLPAADKLELVARIWDDLATAEEPTPLPNWAISKAAARRDAMLKDPNLGVSHDQAWKNIDDSRNG